MGEKISEVIKGLREAVGTNDMMAYLVMMAIRLVELHRILKTTGSLYLHCDPTASHYLKIILDAIFEPVNFRNEIVWKRSNPHSDAKRYGNNADRILFYTKSDDFTWTNPTVPLDEEYIKKMYRFQDSDGRIYRSGPLDAESLSGGGYQYVWNKHNRIWRVPKPTMIDLDKNNQIHYSASGLANRKLFLDERKGIPLQTTWDDIHYVVGKERMGYPTQKPLVLLERIINASSNEGDIVLDPFCGCGTAIHAAQQLNRSWIGIDITHLAIGLIEYRIKESFKVRPTVIGIPTTLESAQNLADRDKFQFEAWAVTRIDRIMPNKKKGKDKGIDGRGYIHVGPDSKGRPKHEKIIVSVKGGKNIGPAMIRDLKGTVQREEAGFGIFICIKEPTSEMKKEAASSGMFETPLETKHPKIQIYTIKDYFDGKMPDLPQISNMMQVPEPEQKKSGTQTTF